MPDCKCINCKYYLNNECPVGLELLQENYYNEVIESHIADIWDSDYFESEDALNFDEYPEIEINITNCPNYKKSIKGGE